MTTLLDHLREMLAYDRWANERSLVSIESIPEARRSGAAYDRLTALVPHNLIARRVWRWRLRGDAYENPKAWFPPMSVAATRDLAREVDAEWNGFLDSFGPADLERVVQYRTSDGSPHARKIRIALVHVFNHGTHHRGQIARLVTEHGGTRAETDYPIMFPEG